jgi:hypothetical protein
MLRMNAAKVIVLGKVTIVVNNDIRRICAKLVLVKSKELAGITILFKKKAMALAIRIAREVSSRCTNLSQFALVNFKPTVTRILVFGKGSVHG